MIKFSIKAVFNVATCFLAVVLLSFEVAAQNKRDILGSYRDWDALVSKASNGAKTCYMISVPKSSKASRKGASRGDIYLTITHRPKYGIKDELNVIVGYPLKVGSEVSASIDGKRAYKLFTEGRGAWAYDPKDDAALVKAMKRGNRLVVNGTSQRGTRTTDRYSLSGFTAAYNAITRACR